ncbi:MAG TPA: hypothetical protein VI319_06420 [Burkholderiales bacterium]
MKARRASIGDLPVAPTTVTDASEPIGFPRVHAAIKWAIVVALVLMAILAAAFWALILGGFAASGFHASDPAGGQAEVVITPECAWPYSVDDHDAQAVCRMFYRLTPEQRAQVLKARK